MKQTSDGIIKNIDWNLRIVCQRIGPDFGKLWGFGKECDPLVGNLKTMWDIKRKKSTSIAINIHLFNLIMDHQISKPHLNITMQCSTTGTLANTVD